MRQLWTMTASDLRQRVRDKSVIIFAVIVPLALMVVFNFTFGAATDLELDEVAVAVSAPAEDPLADTLVDATVNQGAVEVTASEVSADEVRRMIDDEEVQLGIIVPDDFGATISSGSGAVVDIIQGEGSGVETAVLISVIEGVLRQFDAGMVTAVAGTTAQLPPDQLAQLAQAAATAAPDVTIVEGEAASEQLTALGALVAGQAGLFLLFTVGFGVLGLVAEREQGTMARLLSMPMRRSFIVAAKGLVSFILGVVATSVLLTIGSVLFDVDFGSPVTVAALILCAVAAATSLMFIIARVSRTAEQANIVQSILAILLGIAGGAFFPLNARGILGTLLDLNPIAAFIRGLGISSGGGGIVDIGVPVLYMLGFAVVSLGVARIVPDRGRAL
ncbi:MAG: ABC transporter permease [Georgenia sp.]